MEPMTLGSPVNSPPHHGYQQHQGQQYPYSQVCAFFRTSHDKLYDLLLLHFTY